jgi:hypothetical protein
MPAGCPRTVSFSVEKMIELGKEMVAWVKEHKPIHLSMWYQQEKDFTDKQWETFIDRKEFVPYYEKALKLVGYAYIDKNSNVDPRLKERWQRVYFKDLRGSEDIDADANEERKARALKGDARALEIERLKVIDEVQRTKRTLK